MPEIAAILVRDAGKPRDVAVPRHLLVTDADSILSDDSIAVLLEATGATAVEMPRSRERAMCCGGGGARAFMEESIGTRIGVERAREALGTGATVVATACPFCTTMLSDGVASQDGQARVTDVATLMLEAVKRGQ